MINILAYGDSLTWGSDPRGGSRHPIGSRWPEAMAAELGREFIVVTDGLRGRTTAFDQTASPANANGAAILPTSLHVHAPIDLVIIMLGTNDIWFGFGPKRAGDGLRRLVEVIQGHAFRTAQSFQPKILLVAPPPMVESDDPDITSDLIAETQSLSQRVKYVAEMHNVPMFDAASVCHASPIDGVHMDAKNTATLGRSLAPVVKSMFDRS